MLNVMRENLRHLKWVLILVAFSLLVYLGAGWSCGNERGPSANWAATVNGTEISTEVFNDTAILLHGNYRQMLGDQFEQLKPNLRIGTQTIQKLVEDEIMIQEAEKLGLDATKQEITRIVVNEPAFKDERGIFVGVDEYVELINRRYSGGVNAFEANLSRGIVQDKWQNLVTEPIDVSDHEVEQAYRSRNEKASIRYVVVASSDQEPSLTISDDELRAWYDTHQDDYRRPEGRKMRYVVFERQAMTEKVEIADDELQSYYDTNSAAYSRPEQRRARHILLRVEPGTSEEDKAIVRERAEAIRESALAGDEFATLAQDNSDDTASASQGGDLGLFGRGDMVPEFDEAAFNTPVGQIAPLIETQYGFHILEVTEAVEASTTPLEELAEDIRRLLAARKAQDLVQSEAQRVRSAIDAPGDLSVVAESEGLEVFDRIVTADDRMADLAPSPALRDAILQGEPGSVTEALGVARGLAIAVIDEEVPPAVPPLEEIENEIRTAILNDRARAAAVESATAALARRGELDAAAKTLNAEIEESGELAPGRIVLPGTGGDSPELRQALFAEDASVGDSGVVGVESGALIYEITERVAFDRDEFLEAREGVRREMLLRKRQALLQAIMMKLRDSYDVQINAELVDRYDNS